MDHPAEGSFPTIKFYKLDPLNNLRCGLNTTVLVYVDFLDD